jgi:hypothetical protein
MLARSQMMWIGPGVRRLNFLKKVATRSLLKFSPWGRMVNMSPGRWLVRLIVIALIAENLLRRSQAFS